MWVPAPRHEGLGTSSCGVEISRSEETGRVQERVLANQDTRAMPRLRFRGLLYRNRELLT
jgi:hypothetical protein